MKNIDINYVCTLIGNLAGIPVRIYAGEKQVFYYSLVPLPADPIAACLQDIQKVQANVGYFITPHSFYYGIVNSADTKFVIGPTREVAPSNQELRELAFQADVPPEDIDDFVSAMKSIVRMPLDSVMQMLCTFNYILNGEKLELRDITIYDSQQDAFSAQLEQQRNEQAFSADFFETQAHPNVHNTYAFEQKMLHMIRRGEADALKETLASAPAVRAGTLSSNQLRQWKNTFIVTTTLVSRTAIQGGMDVDDALSLSDEFIQKCEMLSSMDRIVNLQYLMVVDYAERMQRLLPGAAGKLTTEVANYIRRHLSQPITVNDIAASLFMSRPYLSRKFKAETGGSLTDFILKEKTEEAKRLLRYSDKSATAIGAYLGFSSLGHFSKTFKKYAGRTPSEYRERYSK